MKFSDGMEFNTKGKLRVVWKPDGYYVIGNGFLCYVGSWEEGDRMVKDMRVNEPVSNCTPAQARKIRERRRLGIEVEIDD